MSDFFAEAEVLIRPNTAGFRAELQTELLAATRGLTVPVPVVPVGATAAQFGAITTQANAAAASMNQFAKAEIIGATAAKNADKAAAAHARTLGQVEKAAAASGAGLLGLRGAVLTAGGAFLGATVGFQAFIKSVQSAADLERQLNVFRVTAQATGDEMERVSDQAVRLGRDISLPGVTAGDAATAMTEFARAGLSVQDSMDGARGALQLATAAQVDNVAATQLVANALNAFSLNGEEAVRVADLLTGAANESQGSIEDMGIALRQSAGAAAQIGLSIEDTVSLLTVLAQAGLAGSDAGTTLRVALLRLVAPTKAAQEQLEQFNIQLRDTQGNVRVQALFELEAALRGVSSAEADAARVAIFGQNAFRVSALLGRQGAKGFREVSAAVTEAGLAAELAGAQTEGFSGDVENLRNQAESLGTTLGQLAIPPLGLFARTLADVAGAANTAASGLKDVIDELAGVGKAAGDSVPFLDQAASGFGKIASTAIRLQFLGPVVTAASLALEQFGDEGEEAGEKMNVLDGILKSVKGTIDELTAAILGAAGVTGPAEGLSPEQITKRVTGFEAQQVQAQIRQSNEDLLASLEEERQFLEQQIQRAVVRRRPALRRQLEQELLSVINEIRSIQESAARETKSAADDAARARREADREVLDAIGLREQRAQNAVIAAEATEAIQDDIRANIKLREVYEAALREIKRTVTDAKTRATAIAAATQDLIRVNAEIRRARQELIQQRQEERAERVRERAESLSLDVQIAEATGNRQREIRARKAEIEFLKRQVDAAKNGSIEQKRLLAELRQKQRELRELKEEAIKTKDAFREMTFEFLTTQQGFAANLLGNLIPTGATGGLVSPVAEPPQASRVNQAAALAQTQAGFSKAEVATELDLLRAMLSELKAIRGGQGHPEAKIQRQRSGSAMDTQ